MREWVWLHCPAWLLRFKLVRRALGVMAVNEIDWGPDGRASQSLEITDCDLKIQR
jgi:hypothetical protein